jgi:hypothetical protein
MIANPSQVIVASREQLFRCHHHRLAVHHREYPEAEGEGCSPEDAATHLIELLSRTLDHAPSDWRRESLQNAIEDVRAFIKRGDSRSAAGLTASPRLGASAQG